MILCILAFLAGDLYLQTFNELPGLVFISSLLAGAMTIAMIGWRCCRLSLVPLAFAAGFAFSVWYAHTVLSWTLNKNLENKPILVKGYISSLPLKQQFGMKFLFTLEHSNAKLSLNNKDENLLLHAGDKWQLLVRLKRIHGIQSPGAFDYEAWSLQKGIRAAGYVLTSPDNILLKSAWYNYPLQRIREYIKARIDFSSLNPWLMALIIGEREGIAQEDWKILRRTGTNHLMAIAGLHIGIVALLVHGLTIWIWRRSKGILYLPATHAGSITALAAAMSYSTLAGFSLPTQRACIMLGIYIFTLLKKRETNSWNVWSVTLLILLLLNPLSVLSQNFWLSLGTIALIIYGMRGRLAPGGLWWRWGRVQWVIAFGLIPLSLLFYQEISLIAFIANCIAIPWLSLILPICLLSVPFLFMCQPVSHALLLCADRMMAGLWIFLSWCSHLSAASIHQSIPNYYIFILVFLAILLFLSPKGFPGKWLGLIWLLPLFTHQYERPANGEMVLSILDVGQGLSAVVQTEHHLLVYDAGPAFLNLDMGENVVVPYLRSSDAGKLNMLVISHGDNDHIGGARSILNAFAVEAIKTSVVERIPAPATDYCLSGVKWMWDGISFEFIYPDQIPLKAKNDDSCVLRIDNGKTTILLPGDIEKSAEKKLIAAKEELLKTDILIAPHHGSKTSALPGFVHAVQPGYVIYATGYLNRYHFPNQKVVETFNNLNAQQFNTADTGTIKIIITKSDMNIELYRLIHKHYWG